MDWFSSEHWLLLGRAISSIAWAGVAIYCMPAAFSAGFGRNARERDAMRLAFFAVSLVMIGFAARWYVVPESDGVWIGLYVLSGATGAYAFRLLHAYGRGPRD